MRAYIAVIRDSFHEAFVSRVLWILLVLITVFLLTLLPISIDEQRISRIGMGDFLDVLSFAAKITEQGPGSEPSPARQIWLHLDDGLKDDLSDRVSVGFSERRGGWRLLNRLCDNLNALDSPREFYDDDAWSHVELSGETRKLIEQGIEGLDDGSVARLNYLLITQAFPDEIDLRDDAEIRISYLTMAFGTPFPLEKKQLIETTLMVVTSFLVGTLGVFIAILVTASMIPQTYEAGAIDLLLSKPVNRSLLFLTKFAGGCAFIFINILYFIGGLWLVVGLRFDFWHNRMLLCIPLFLFLFAIYYGVSALAGVVWKNAVVSVVVTILFWAACFSIGTSKGILDQLLLDPTNLVRLIEAGDILIAANERGEVFRWDDAAEDWEEILKVAEPMPFGINIPLRGLVYDASADRLLAIRGSFQFTSGPFGRPVGPRSSGAPLVVARRSENWVPSEGPRLTDTPIGLMTGQKGEIYLVGRRDLYRLEKDSENQGAGEFKAVGPRFQVLSSNGESSINFQTGALAMSDGDRIAILEPDAAGRFEQTRWAEIEDGDDGLVAYGSGSILLAFENGEMRLFEEDGLALRHTFRPQGNNAPRFAETSPDGRWFAVVFHNGKLWLYDNEKRQPVDAGVSGQGSITAAAFTNSSQLLVAGRYTRVTEYEPDSFQVVRRFRPELSLLEKAYRYAIHPIHTVFPKPAELDSMVAYILTGEESAEVQLPGQGSLSAARMKLDIWGPVWSNLAFLAVVLALGCLRVQRKDY